jgi:ribonuclease J
MVDICTVGGYNEVGKNMTAIKIGDSTIIMDMGLHIESFVRFKGDEEVEQTSANALLKADAIPDDRCIEDWKKTVKLIVPTHAHLDHVGAIPYMADKYGVPVVGTPYTIEVLKTILRDEKFKIKNQLRVLNTNSTMRVNKEITLEFINVTHSTPQTVIAALHTREGTILYANDFKFDSNPTLGSKPNFERLQELGRKGQVKALIVDGTRATRSGKTPSESIAREMLREVMLDTDSKNGMVIVTTFSSHLARLKSIIEFGKKMNRKIIFMGRSLAKYVEAGEAIGIVKFSKDVEIVKYRDQIRKRLKQISKEKRDKYILVVTGHQGEPDSVLSRMVKQELPFDFHTEDHIVFSCSVIPNPSNIANRELMEADLKKQRVRIFKDIHTSGHASKEDLRDLINMVKPKHIIPAHGDFTMITALADLCIEMGYKVGENVHIMKDGQRVHI